MVSAFGALTYRHKNASGRSSWGYGAVYQAKASQVKYFIDRFKATGPYKRNNAIYCNKITNTTLYPNKNNQHGGYWTVRNAKYTVHIFTQEPDGFTIVWA